MVKSHSVWSQGGFKMSMVHGGLVWPAAYCTAHHVYDYDYIYPYVAQPLSHVDMLHYPFLGEHWHGFHIYENCKYCAQPLVATSDPRVNYCQNCGTYQWHRL
jgi:hypothetical protein